MNKKFIITLFSVAILVLCLGFKEVKASSNNNEPVNLLDLNNIVIYDHSYLPISCANKRIATKQSIKVKAETRHTLVIHKDFYTVQSWNDIQQYPVPDAEIHFYADANPEIVSEGDVELIQTEDYFYGTFITTYENLIIASIAVETPNLSPRSNKIMLFEGSIDQFHSFTGYKTNYEPGEGVFIMDYDNRKSIQELIELFAATDDIEGDIDHKIVVIKDGFTPYMHLLGSHKLTFMVCDEACNKAFYNLTIKVVDITPPTITGYDYYEVEVGNNDLTLDYIEYNLEVYDNYRLKQPNCLEIIEDNYTPNKNRAGEYEVIFKATDYANNYSYFTVTVKNIDNDAPILEGPAELYCYTTDQILSAEEIKAYFQAHDAVDGNLSDYIVVSGTYNNIPGSYDILIEVADFSGNLTTKTLKMHVVDGVSPTFYANELVLTFAEVENMDAEDIIEWLLARIDGSSEMEILLNETDYKRSNNEKMYIYYGYTLGASRMYGRITVTPSSYINKTSSIIGICMIVFNALFLVIQYKKRKY